MDKALGRLQNDKKTYETLKREREAEPPETEWKITYSGKTKVMSCRESAGGPGAQRNKQIPLEKSYNPETTKQLHPWECELKREFKKKKKKACEECGTTGDEE